MRAERCWGFGEDGLRRGLGGGLRISCWLRVEEDGVVVEKASGEDRRSDVDGEHVERGDDGLKDGYKW
jgi:hypothetical protein